VLLDGAHNIAGVETLVAAVEKDFGEIKRTLILGVLADKDWQPMCELLAPLAERIVLVPVESKRAAKPELLAEVFRVANPKAQVCCADTLAQALERTAKDGFIVIAGSLYLIGAALVLLDPEFSASGDERGLNEWGGSQKSASL
jgi:dihydrofolate synthase/folylpolyglutamate synthase